MLTPPQSAGGGLLNLVLDLGGAVVMEFGGIINWCVVKMGDDA